MAVLTDPRRAALWQELMSDLSAPREGTPGLLKADIHAAVNAMDDFLSANAAAIKSAIPQPARSALSNAQLARMMVIVVRYRYIDGA